MMKWDTTWAADPARAALCRASQAIRSARTSKTLHRARRAYNLFAPGVYSTTITTAGRNAAGEHETCDVVIARVGDAPWAWGASNCAAGHENIFEGRSLDEAAEDIEARWGNL